MNNTNQSPFENMNTINQNINQNNAYVQNRLSVFPANYMYGQSYVPIQYIENTFRPEVGLQMGSIFPELIVPYEPGDSMEEIAYLQSKNN